jgi:SAM-dependent methyltransferase
MTSLRERWQLEGENWAYVTRHRHLASDHHQDFNFPYFLSLLPSPSGRTLEVGCGEGRIVRALRAGGYEIEGVDVSETLVAAARRADPHGRYAVADAAALPYPDDSFELVVAFMSLQDIDDFGQAIAEAGRVLESGGRFCFAILHPLRTAGTFPTEASGALTIEGSYFERREFMVADEIDGVRVEMYSEHRPLEAYTLALQAAGFVLEAVREPRPFEDVIRSDGSGISEKWRRIPLVLHVRAELRPGP